MTSQTSSWKKSSYSDTDGNCVQVALWKKSSYSDIETNCVEVAFGPVTVLVRDSKNVAGPVLGFTATGWGAFLASVKGERRAG